MPLQRSPSAAHGSFLLQHFLCHVPVPEQISVLIQVYRDQLLMCLWNSLHRTGLWWLSQRNQCLCFYPCTHLQAEEEGRRPTLSTLHIGLCEVRWATSAWRLIKRVICKPRNKSYATQTQHWFCRHLNSLVLPSPPKGNHITSLSGLKGKSLYQITGTTHGAVLAGWFDPVYQRPDPRPYVQRILHRELQSPIHVPQVPLRAHCCGCKGITGLFCNLSKPQAPLKLLNQEWSTALQVLISFMAK